MNNASGLNVSRETYIQLEGYVDLLLTWTKKINLISSASIPDVWERHIRDSVQVFNAAPRFGDIWLDIGSGGGLPGLVVAILSKEEAPDTSVTLIESDLRKATFLRTVVRELALNANVISARIDEADRVGASTISARALGTLDSLLGFADYHLLPDGTAVFPKGATWQKEVDKARESWRFDLDVVESITDKKAAILIIGGIARV